MASFNPPHSIHIHNATPIMHRVYNPPQQHPGPYVRNPSQHPYQMNYHPSFYPFPPGYDPNVSLAHPYIYDPTQVKHRRRTTPEQLKILEDTFKTDPKPNATLRKQLSLELGMSPRVLQVWFQNRRMKVKRLARKGAAAVKRESPAHAESKNGDNESESATSPPADSPISSSADKSAPVSSRHSPTAMTPCTTDNHESPSSPTASTHSSSAASRNTHAESPCHDFAARLAPPQDIRRGSLPALGTSNVDLSDGFSGPSSASSVSADRLRLRPASSAFECAADPVLVRRRSMTSLQRLESHPFAGLVAANNGIPHPPSHTSNIGPIVTPSLPPSFMSRPMFHHHHSPSTPAANLAGLPGGLVQTNRSASFHTLPGEHHLHAFSHQHQHQQPPYAFPPRPLPAPGPGPLPAPDFSFGTSTPPTPDEMQEEFDVRPYVPAGASSGMYSVQATAAAAAGVPVPRLVRYDDDNETSYTGYSSRFGSIASVAESDTSTSASVSGHSTNGGAASSASGSCVSLDVWDGNDTWGHGEGVRRGSWTGQVAEMLSGLDVRGEDKSEANNYDTMWADSPNPPYASSSSQESLGAYNEDELVYPESKECTPPAAQQQQHRRHPHQDAHQQQPHHNASRLPISQSSELAYALFDGCGAEKGSEWVANGATYNGASSPSGSSLCAVAKQQDDGQQNYAHGRAGGGDEMLELHHAMAGYAEHPSVDELAASYSIGTFTAPGQDGDAPYNMY